MKTLLTSLLQVFGRKAEANTQPDAQPWEPPKGWAVFCSPLTGEIYPPLDADILVIRDGWDRPPRTSRRQLAGWADVSGLRWCTFSDHALDRALDDLLSVKCAPVHRTGET